MNNLCYYKNCNNRAISDEHAPPKCFFINKKGNLITVPSCSEHNTEKSGDDEYIRNIFSLHYKNNETGIKMAETKTIRSFKNSRKLFERILKDIKFIENKNSISFDLDIERIEKWMTSLSYAIYRNNFNKNYQGDWYIIDDTSAIIVENNDNCDIAYEANIRGFVKNLKYEEIKTDNPETFKYSRHLNNDKILYKFIFYESIVYYSYSR